jgi:hypothetical protein
MDFGSPPCSPQIPMSNVFLALGETPGWWAVLGGSIIIVAVTGRTIAVERRGGSVPREEFGVLGAES